MEIAKGGLKSIPMNLFMGWMIGNTLNLFHSSCTNQDAYLLRLIHDTPSNAGCKIQFDVGNNHCCEIGANNSDNKEFNISLSKVLSVLNSSYS